MSLHIHANAKVNIGLHILGRRADGYHLMETLYYPVAGLADALVLTPGAGEGCTVRMEGLDESLPLADNLCWKAWRAMAERFRPAGNAVDIQVRKGIPTGAGLGGGSSDAAAVLLGLRQLWELPVSDAELAAIGEGLGADVPFFVYNRPMYATGIGTVFTEFPLDLAAMGYRIDVRTLPWHSSTPLAFRGLDLSRIPQGPSLMACLLRPITEWQDCVRNDLAPSVIARIPAVGEAVAALKKEGAIYAAMTGSGSACFGIFPTSE
jgi:4-diphosphocytidyl-2-C-methyl-D-erythritol kinase